MRHLKTIFDAYRDGARIDDDELEALRANMERLDDLCRTFGERFALTGNYARHVVQDCRSFQRARAEGKKRDADRKAFAEAR